MKIEERIRRLRLAPMRQTGKDGWMGSDVRLVNTEFNKHLIAIENYIREIGDGSKRLCCSCEHFHKGTKLEAHHSHCGDTRKLLTHSGREKACKDFEPKYVRLSVGHSVGNERVFAAHSLTWENLKNT